MALVDPGEHQGRKIGIPRRVISQPQHGHVQAAVRHHVGDLRHGTITGADDPEPGRRRAGAFSAGAMFDGQYQPTADQVAGAELLLPIAQGRDHRDNPVHPDR